MNKQSLYSRLCSFLQDEGIEYMAALPFSSCEIINERRLPPFEPKSVLVFLIPYYTGEYDNRNVSLYSVSRDYHLYASLLEEHLLKAFDIDKDILKVYSDSSPVNERSLAIKAGLGVMGQNRLVINEKYGSYVFIGTVFTSAVFDKMEYACEILPKKCNGCGMCKSVCPFLRGERDVCLSELNQRKKVTDDELALIKSYKIRWGCDLCQQACPMNGDVAKTPIGFFYQKVLPVLTCDTVSTMSDSDFNERAYSWRGKNVILRNLQ